MQREEGRKAKRGKLRNCEGKGGGSANQDLYGVRAGLAQGTLLTIAGTAAGPGPGPRTLVFFFSAF